MKEVANAAKVLASDGIGFSLNASSEIVDHWAALAKATAALKRKKTTVEDEREMNEMRAVSNVSVESLCNTAYEMPGRTIGACTILILSL